MSDIVITLTHEDFKKSFRYLSNENCALAVAIKRQMNPKKLWVGGNTVDIDKNEYRIKEGKFTILDGYDMLNFGKFIEPFSVTLVSKKSEK